MLTAVFEILSTTPETIRREIASLSPRQMKNPPAPGKWSVQLILAHLDDVEEHGFRRRVAAIVDQDRPFLATFDQEARVTEMRYDRKDPRKTLESFARQRKTNLKWLRTLRLAEFKRKGVHEQVGEMSAEEYLYEWAFHDLGHLKQILEVKRYALYPRIGNMQKYYRLT